MGKSSKAARVPLLHRVDIATSGCLGTLRTSADTVLLSAPHLRQRLCRIGARSTPRRPPATPAASSPAPPSETSEVGGRRSAGDDHPLPSRPALGLCRDSVPRTTGWSPLSCDPGDEQLFRCYISAVLLEMFWEPAGASDPPHRDPRVPTMRPDGPCALLALGRLRGVQGCGRIVVPTFAPFPSCGAKPVSA